MLASQFGVRGRPQPSRPGVAPAAPATGHVIPYDYGATFALTGRPGNVIQDVINISPDGVFVATAIGYGFEEERGRPLSLGVTDDSFQLGDVPLSQLPFDALIEGFRVNPRFERLVFDSQDAGPGARGPAVGEGLSQSAIPRGYRDSLLEKVRAKQEVSFLFSMVDSSSGRELQDEPTHNLASLGIGTGDRPFRPLAQPLSFLPRSTLRLQVEERSYETRGTLFIVLYGYRILAGAGCPEPVLRGLHAGPVYPGGGGGLPPGRVIPFDYVASLRLEGRPGLRSETEVAINTEGGYVATSIGYGLAVDEAPLTLDRSAFNYDVNGNVPIGDVPLRSFPASTLRQGIRLRPDLVHLAFQSPTQLATQPVALIDTLFESLNRPEDVSFRYTLFDTGSGSELQNEPLHNLAGLGTATGERPFKRFARPLTFLPRATLRLGIEEHVGRGTLFLVLQGYKVLGRPAPGARR